MKKSIFIIIFLIAVITNSLLAQLKIALPYQPQIYFGTEFKSIVYEIHMMDSLQRPIQFLDFIISANNKILLHDTVYESLPKKSEINRYVKYIWINIDQIPKLMLHRIKYKIGNKTFEFTKEITIKPDSILTIGLPVKKGRWYMQAAPSPKSEHRLFTIPIKTIYDSLQSGFILGHCNQRFAIDFAKVGDTGLLYKKNGHKNSEHYCYSEDVIAVSNGIVVGVIDSIEENIPPEYDENNKKIATGNLVMLDIGNGILASYAHLIPYSIKVKVGDSLRKGDIIGKIGNSGNSTAPHLHFQLSKPDYHLLKRDDILGMFLLSEGISFVFHKYKKYELISGKFIDSDGTTEFISEPFIMTNPKDIENSLPYENEIIGIK